MPLSKLFDPLPWSRKRVTAPLRERAEFFCVRHFYNRMIRLAPRSLDPYSTHLPILCSMAAIIQPTRVVEYGSGLISTTTFLNRTIFPRLTSLLSFENDREWYERVAGHIGDDPRLQLRLVEGTMKDAVARFDLDAADLVFVDDYDSVPLPGRADTIAALAALRPTRIPVVIHDLELWRFRRSAGRFEHVFRFDALNPQTGVVWNGSWDLADCLPAINRFIKKHSGIEPMSDVEQWTMVFRDARKLVRPS